MDGSIDRSIDLTGCRFLHGSIALDGVVIELWVGATTPPTHRTNSFSTSLRAISDEADTASARQRIHGLIESTARFIESILCAIAPSADRWVGRGWVGLNVVGAGSVDDDATAPPVMGSAFSFRHHHDGTVNLPTLFEPVHTQHKHQHRPHGRGQRRGRGPDVGDLHAGARGGRAGAFIFDGVGWIDG